jgi:magnesium transporter
MAADTTSHVEILLRRPDASVERVEIQRLEELAALTREPDTLAWVHVFAPTDALVRQLQAVFALHPLAVEDLLKQHQRPKIDTYAEQHVVVAYEATDPDGGDAGLSEVHIFVGDGWLLSVHWAPAPLVESVHRRLAARPASIGATRGALLYALLDAAVDSYFPELDRLSERIDALEESVIEADADRTALREVLAVKRRLLELRRVLAPMRDVANALLRRETPLVDAATTPYFQDLYDHLVRVLDQLDVYRDLLATVLDARLTVASNALNAIMKRLTAFTVVLMIPTLIAGIYGMNFDLMPELNWALGYPYALLLMVLSAAGAIAFFRAHRWF